jgi:hypothetical protein
MSVSAPGLPASSPARRRAVAVGAGAAAAVATAVALAGPSPAGRSAPSPPEPPAAGAVVRRAQALVDIRPAALGYRLRITGARPGVLAETDTGTRTITLRVGAAAVPHLVAHDLAHELGHAFDDRHLTAAARAAYLETRGAAGAPWWPANAAADYRTGAGDFAEVFALCHAASPEFRSRLAPRPRDACAALPPAARGPQRSGGST